jgi:hypothetical protein
MCTNPSIQPRNKDKSEQRPAPSKTSPLATLTQPSIIERQAAVNGQPMREPELVTVSGASATGVFIKGNGWSGELDKSDPRNKNLPFLDLQVGKKLAVYVVGQETSGKRTAVFELSGELEAWSSRYAPQQPVLGTIHSYRRGEVLIRFTDGTRGRIQQVNYSGPHPFEQLARVYPPGTDVLLNVRSIYNANKREVDLAFAGA